MKYQNNHRMLKQYMVKTKISTKDETNSKKKLARYMPINYNTNTALKCEIEYNESSRSIMLDKENIKILEMSWKLLKLNGYEKYSNKLKNLLEM